MRSISENMHDNVIKKYEDFVKNRGFRKMLSRLVIEGEVKPKFFWNKKKDFEIHIFFTSVKKAILQIELEGDVNLKELNLPFGIGSNISEAYDWANNEGHKIVFELNR